jgi:hypothetical protein
MENDWRHSQCSKVELNLRVTLVLFRTRRRMSAQGCKKCEASRSKKPSEGSRWRGGRGPYAN